MAVSQALDVRPQLTALTADEIEDLSTDDRRAEVFFLHSTGWTQAKLARHFGVVQATISKDLKIEYQRRHTRAENIEEELERIAGVIENVMVKAWDRHNEAFEHNPNGVAASNYLKLVMEAAERYAHIRGLDMPRLGSNSPKGQTRVIVQIGGSAEQPAIQVGVET